MTSTIRRIFRRVKLDKTPQQLATSAAKAAYNAASARLEETEGRWPEVNGRAERLAAIRTQNHFAEAIRAAVLGEGNT
jgi:hypothetical protein